MRFCHNSAVIGAYFPVEFSKVYGCWPSRMPSAIWNGAVLAQSDETIVVEGNHYFPPDSLNREYLEPSNRHTTCWWKGVASYYDVVVDGSRNPSAAWYYPEPSAKAEAIKDYVAFWGGVRVER